ncbi:MAG: universal stress protein [Dehalococcoidia bacterium]|nr:universal stress protein [Dehalococcoidia bacterium]MDD5647366.1 universal stress protein [Dehalococcoidia bacterium]
MFKKILVPLDGSTEAETVLPYVRDIAIRFDSEVYILGVGLGSKRRRVNQLLDNYVHHAVEHLQKNDITCRAVLLYSDSHQELLNYTEVTTREHEIKAKGRMLYGGPPESILAYSRDHHMNLIIMATHGISGLRRWWLGSVFEKVASRATVPVLGIHSKQVREMDRDRKAAFKRILAPLDGSETGGAAMHDAEAIALKTGASIVLVHVLPAPHAIEARWLGPEFTGFVKAMHDAGQKYLDKVDTRLSARGLDVKVRIVSGDPAGKIIEVAREEKADLIAMSTHGRSGIARWVLGSVADKILHESRIPMWLVRPRQIVKEMLKDSGQDGK